jgi:hypothetical protein
MNRSTAMFGAIAIVTGVAAAVLWQQLRDERAMKAQPPQTTQAQVPEEPMQQLPDVQITAPATGKRRPATTN